MVFLANMEATRNDPTHAEQHDHGHQQVPSDLALCVRALESLLVEKGLVDPAALDALIDAYEHKIGPRNELGAGVARSGLPSTRPVRVLSAAYRERVPCR